MDQAQDDHYALLGIGDSATADDIRKAYVRLAKPLNPELFTESDDEKTEAQSKLSRLTLAHEVLSDSQRRAEYDTQRQLARGEVDLVQSRKAQAQTTHEEENANVRAAKRHQQAANQLFDAKKYRDAENAIKEAIRLMPHEAKYHLKLAEIYLARGWRRLAIVEARAGLDLASDDEEAIALERRLSEMAETLASTAIGSDSGAEKSDENKVKNGFFDQLKDLFSGKKR